MAVLDDYADMLKDAAGKHEAAAATINEQAGIMRDVAAKLEQERSRVPSVDDLADIVARMKAAQAKT